MATTLTPPTNEARPHHTHRRETAIALCAWVALIASSWFLGSWLNATQSHTMLVQAPPLTAQFDLRLSPWLVPALAVGVAAARWAPGLFRRLPWRRLLAASAAAAFLWALVVGIGAVGPAHLTESLRAPTDAFNDLARIGSPASFLHGFTENLPGFATHTRGHPPGLLLLFWAMQHLGLDGRGWAALIEIAGGASAVPACLIALREVGGETSARLAAPFLAIAPMAFFVATSADALYMGVAAWGAALVILATGPSSRRRSGVLGAAGGVLFGTALFLSYGVVLVALVPAAVAIRRRTGRPLMFAAAGALAVVAAFALGGFWWVGGLLATRIEYFESIARYRPYWYFLFANLAALAIVLGPASAAGLTRLRDRNVWLLVGAALAGVFAADLSGLSKAETERIWLPFAVWVLVANTSLGDPKRARVWLGTQVIFTLLLVVGVHSTW